MNQQIVIHSLEELGQFADLIAPEDELAPPITEQVEMTTDLAALAAAASRAAAQLQELVERDAVARREAELALAQHHRLQEEIDQLERITGEAFNCYDCYVAEQDVAQIAKELTGSASVIERINKGPKHQIESGKIRALGMTFGGTELLRRTVGELVAAHRK